MAATNNASYEYIQNKIRFFKDSHLSFRDKTDDYIFSAICVKGHLYKNPALYLSESDLQEMIVDGQGDGGVDILLTDPESEECDLIIAQSKYYTSITKDDVSAALNKMALFYKNMNAGHYEQVNAKVQRRFLSLNSERAENSKVRFVFYTSAAQSGIRRPQIIQHFKDQFDDSSQIEVELFFGKDIEEEIKESESRRPTVENGKIRIDEANNCLWYGENAAIVNVSAFSIKALYAQYNIQLLSKNLRYHIAGKEIDKGINETIQNEPETFWMKNNGITVICDDFRVDGKEVKLRNFSIINGGQTTYMIHKNQCINEENDFFLPCKIIRSKGETEDKKNEFSLAIAKASNTQKPIKPVDLKANAPEQVRFSQAMREVGIFYQTKRGEEVPSRFREAYLNTSLFPAGKLMLAAIFQLPCSSRTKPSMMYLSEYYDKMFDHNQLQIAKICKELLYIDYYFRNRFIKEFDRENRESAASDYISFAHNARTVCVAFVALASRYYQKNITDQQMQDIFDEVRHENESGNKIYAIFSNIDGLLYLFPAETFQDKNRYDEILSKLFNLIIDVGSSYFAMAKDNDSTLTTTNFLKRDRNYYKFMNAHWPRIKREIKQILKNVI